MLIIYTYHQFTRSRELCTLHFKKIKLPTKFLQVFFNKLNRSRTNVKRRCRNLMSLSLCAFLCISVHMIRYIEKMLKRSLIICKSEVFEIRVISY